MVASVFRYKSPNRQKLLDYGFAERAGFYEYATDVCDGQFHMTVIVAAGGDVRTELIDQSTGEPYTLHLTGACGAFVGLVRSACEKVLSELAERCFEKDVFKSDVARSIVGYVRDKYGDELEFLWPKFPDNAVWRRKDNRKWYGVLLVVAKNKLGLADDSSVAVAVLRVEPERLSSLVDGKKFFPAYHMNKKYWISVILDGSVPAEEIFGLIDRSYMLAKNENKRLRKA